MRARDAGDVFDGLDGADLVIGVHDGHQRGLRADLRFNICWLDLPEPVYRQPADGCTSALQVQARLRDGRMLDLGGNDVYLLRVMAFSDALDGHVVRFAAAAGEDHLLRLTA